MPKRSASSITITVASGTSTPTSITVVATSTGSRRRGRRPWPPPSRRRHLAVQEPERRPASSSRPSRSNSSVAERGGHPLGSLDQRADDVGPAAGGDLAAHPLPGLDLLEVGACPTVVIGVRPGGSSSRTVMSRSPKTHHRRGPRDRRGRHDQQVGIRPRPASARCGPCPAASPAARRRSGAARR